MAQTLEVGDRVAYATAPPGAYSDARTVDARHLIRVPESLSSEAVAATLLKGMTVEYLIRRTFRVEPGQTVLWHAAAGGVGLLACQWLAHLGVRVLGTVGSEAKAQLARAHGCSETVLYNQEDFVARVRELTDGVGVSIVYDSVGKDTFAGSLDCLMPRGMMVSFGNASGKPDVLDPLLLSAKGSLFLTRPTLGAYVAARSELLASATALFEVLASGAVSATIGARRPLADVVEAHRALEARCTTGSTVLHP